MGDSIFKPYVERRNSIVKNKSILQTSYVPDQLPHRTKEINEIAGTIAAALKGDKPSNIIMYGKTGTGKTATMNFIGSELKKEDPEGKNCRFVYINCEVVDTQYGILYNIGNQIIVDFEKRIPFTGWSTEKVYSEMKNYIDSQNKVFIIVLDEIDRLFFKNGDDVLYHLSMINEDLKNSKLSLVGISNDLKFMEFLDPRVKSRLGEEKIIFPAYTADQLEDILKNRAELAFEKGIVETGVIPFCAAVAAQEMGDARRALDLLRVGADIAERNGDNVVMMAHIKAAKNKIELDTVTEVVKTLTAQSKIVLMSIIQNTGEGNRTMTTGDVYSIYKEVSNIISSTVLTQRRITDLISELDMLGIVHARVRSFGKAGRTKEIELSISGEVIRILEDDPLFISLREYKSPKQMTII